MWVLYNNQQLFNLKITLDSCRDFLTYHKTHHTQRVKLRLTYYDIPNSIWVPTQQVDRLLGFCLGLHISSRHLYYFFAAVQQLSKFDTSFLDVTMILLAYKLPNIVSIVVIFS